VSSGCCSSLFFAAFPALIPRAEAFPFYWMVLPVQSYAKATRPRLSTWIFSLLSLSASLLAFPSPFRKIFSLLDGIAHFYVVPRIGDTSFLIPGFPMLDPTYPPRRGVSPPSQAAVSLRAQRPTLSFPSFILGTSILTQNFILSSNTLFSVSLRLSYNYMFPLCEPSFS